MPGLFYEPRALPGAHQVGFYMLGVLVSLKREIELYIGKLSGVRRKTLDACTLYTGSQSGVDVKIVVTGIGGGGNTTHIKDCSALVSTGVCGALRDDMETGDLVLAVEVAHAGVEQLTGIMSPKRGVGSGVWIPGRTGLFRTGQDSAVRDRLLDRFKERNITIHAGRTVTCGRIIRNRGEKKVIRSYYDAVAVDMEDYFRFRTAKVLGIPMWSIRAVLDELADTVPSLQGSVNRGAAAALLCKIPAAQGSISLMLENLIPYLAEKVDIV
jgi:adenosylhomocysteine nucleosidase